jgi:hypothetical protein
MPPPRSIADRIDLKASTSSDVSLPVDNVRDGRQGICDTRSSSTRLRMQYPLSYVTRQWSSGTAPAFNRLLSGLLKAGDAGSIPA